MSEVERMLRRTGSAGGSGSRKHPPLQRRGSLDRFIPRRDSTDMDTAYFKFISPVRCDQDPSPATHADRENYRRMMTNLSKSRSKPGGAPDNVLSFSPICKNRPQSPIATYDDWKSDSVFSTPVKKTSRKMCSSPEAEFELPCLRNEFCLNILDWSCKDMIAVALHDTVFVQNATNRHCQELPLELRTQSSGGGGGTEGSSSGETEVFVTCLAWSLDGSVLALGTTQGEIQLWDMENSKLLRRVKSHSTTVGAVAWVENTFYSGSNSGRLCHHDPLSSGKYISRVAAHTGGIVGLKANSDHRYLATGGMDKTVKIWDIQNSGGGGMKLTHSLNTHKAPVKALAWAPFQSNLLASGGALGDGRIVCWNASTGKILAEADTHSQVCSLVWGKSHKELVSSHGHGHDDVLMWRYPSLEPLATLSIPDSKRVLHLVLSPDGTTVAAANANETLCLWRCFDLPSRRRSCPTTYSPLNITIR